MGVGGEGRIQAGGGGGVAGTAARGWGRKAPVAVPAVARLCTAPGSGTKRSLAWRVAVGRAGGCCAGRPEGRPAGAFGDRWAHGCWPSGAARAKEHGCEPEKRSVIKELKRRPAC